MQNKREVILITLGQFGKAVSEYVQNLISERRAQLGELADSVVLHAVEFEDNEKFMSSENIIKLRDSVKDSKAEQTGDKFSYIMVGDLYEQITSRFAIDYAYLPHLLNLDNSLPFDEMIGFFTFADTIGVTEQVTDESIAEIRGFFERLNEINKENYYIPPFNDIMNKSYGKIASPTGPFNRNYFMITRGNTTDVTKSTKIVFSERIFYELFYLNEKFREIEKQISGELALDNNADKNFSCFSMIQIPRINEIQKYYLKFILENEILKFYLAPSLTGTDEDYYREKFFNVIDVPANENEFPIQRAIDLFQFNNHEDMSRILEQYISNGKQDFKDYIKVSLERLNDVVSELRPRYDEFSKSEIAHLNETLSKGFKELFKLDRLAGNINTYLSFVYSLKEKFNSWQNSLENFANSTEIYSLDDDIDRVEKKIKKYQKSKLLSFTLFRPFRKKLIENQIFSLPLELYISSLMQSSLANSLLVQWKNLLGTDNHPIAFCEKLISYLEVLKKRLESKKSFVENKISFIEGIDSYFYIIRMFDDKDDYMSLLRRIRERNFGPLKQEELRKTVSNSFKFWIEDKDLIGIVQDPTGFIEFLENNFVPVNFANFNKIEQDSEQYEKYAKDAVELAIKRTEDLNRLSFRVDNRDSYLSKNELLLEPKMQNDDILTEEIRLKFANFDSQVVPNDFTMGSVIYFKDYLFMNQNDLCKKVILEKYKNVKLEERQYDNAVKKEAEPIIVEKETATEVQKEVVKNSELSPVQNLSFNLINNYLTAEQKVDLYNSIFNLNVESIDAPEITALAEEISYAEILKKFTDEQINQLAKDKDLMLHPQREKMEKRLIMEFEDLLGE